MQFGLLQNFVSLDVPGHSESSESHVTKLLLEMHFLRLVSRPTPQELEQELHAPHVVHSEGEWGSRKIQRSTQEQKKVHKRTLGLVFYVFPHLTNFLFLFLCLFLPQIFLFSLAIQNSNWVLLDFTYLFHLQHRSCPLHFFLFPGQSSLFGLGHCCIRQAGFPGDDLGEVSSLNTVQLFIHTSQWFLENIGISRCFL